jgi:spermidine synthase
MAKSEIPFWKKLLSWVYSIPLESISDHSGRTVTVLLSKGRLQLEAFRAIYSYDDLYLNFTVPLQKEFPKPETNKNVLILGFGLGSIVYILEKKLNCHFNYTAVELDEQILYLASTYSIPRFNSNIEIYQTDGVNYMSFCTETFDLICVDIFEDDIVPDEVASIDFLKNCKRCLKPGGKIFFNRLFQGSLDQFVCKTFEETVFSQVFPYYTHLDVKGNRMLIAGQHQPNQNNSHP